MGAIYQRAFTEQRLLEAWDTVRESAMADGYTSPEIAKFEEEAARQVSELARALADGSFEPMPVMRVEVPKASGGVRRLAIPSVRDRVVERALLAELDPVIDPLLLPWSFAYRRGLGVRDAIARLAEARDAGAQWVARCDINDCFDRIPRWGVMRRLRECVPDPEAVDLVRRFMDRPVVKERTPYSERGLGRHQGSPLSPLLCNLYLDAFDRAMLAAGYHMARFADAIAVPAEDRGGAERALSDVARELAVLRLELDAAKSQVVSFDDGVPFSARR